MRMFVRPYCMYVCMYVCMQHCLQATFAFYGAHYNLADDRIYFALRNAPRAACFDPATKTWESFGDTFPETQMLENDKWDAAAFSSIDNCLYQFPDHCSVAHRMLKIDPANRTAQEVGEDLRPLAPGVNNYLWHAAVANGDGIIFGVPHAASQAIRFDPRTNQLKPFGQLEDTGSFKYWDGVLGPSGRYIFCVPVLASRVLCIDTQELTTKLIGPDFGRGDGANYATQGKWGWGDLGGDGCIYAGVGNARRLLRIDPASMTASLFGPDLTPFGYMPWISLTTGMDGCLYGTPFLTDRILRIDPFAGTVSTIGEALPPSQIGKMIFGAVDRDGAVWLLPEQSPARMVRVAPRRPQTPLLATLLQPQHRAVLHEGLRDMRCYGPALVVALWREAVRAGGDTTLVCRLLEAAATALPTVVTASITEDNGSTASMLLRTIVTLVSPQVGASGPRYYVAGRH